MFSLRSLRLPADPPIDTRPIFTYQDDEQFITMLNPITNITTQRLRLRDETLASGGVRRLMRFSSTDSSIMKREAKGPGDPTENGATLTVYNAAGTSEQETVVLDKENWTETASGEDRTYKLDFDTVAEYGRSVKSLWEARGGRRIRQADPGHVGKRRI